MPKGRSPTWLRPASGFTIFFALVLGPIDAMVQPRPATAGSSLKLGSLQPVLGGRDVHLFLRASMPEVLRDDKKHLVASESVGSDRYVLRIWKVEDKTSVQIN